MSDCYLFKSAKLKDKYIKVSINTQLSKENDNKELEVIKDYELKKNLSLKIINQAKKKAEIIINSAKKHSEDIFKKAYNEGFKKGYNEGFKKAELEYEDKFKKEIQKLIELLNAIDKEKIRYLKELEKEFILLSIIIARKITNSYIKSNSSVVLNNIKRGLNYLLNKEEKIYIFLSKRDYDYIYEKFKNNNIDFLQDINVILKKDANLSDGDCLIKTNQGLEIDLTLDKQMQNLKREISKLLNN